MRFIQSTATSIQIHLVEQKKKQENRQVNLVKPYFRLQRGVKQEAVEQDNKPEYELQIWLAWTL